jgi:hypothetical protein
MEELLDSFSSTKFISLNNVRSGWNLMYLTEANEPKTLFNKDLDKLLEEFVEKVGTGGPKNDRD